MSAPGATAGARLRDPVPSDSRYECLLKIASGGMASVYAGRIRGAKGFRRLVAIKRAHAHLIEDHQFRRSLIDEANLASRIHHPNVVSVLDVEELTEELLLIMDYVEGASLSQLLSHASRRKTPLPPAVVVQIALDVCRGLSAAHELTADSGEPLHLVHRDVSPQNILVGVDGLARIADFGIAKCNESSSHTTTGLKGKFGYMAPEYIQTKKLDARADLFALGTVLWEALTNQRLFRGDAELETINRVLVVDPEPVSKARPGVPPELDEPIRRALAKDPDARFQSAAELARALESAARAAGLELSPSAVGAAVRDAVGEQLDARRTVLREHASGEESSFGSRSRVRLDPSEPTATASIEARLATSATAELPTLPISGDSSAPRFPRQRWPLVAVGGLVAVGAALGVALMREPTGRSAGEIPSTEQSGQATGGEVDQSAPIATADSVPHPVEVAAPIATGPRVAATVEPVPSAQAVGSSAAPAKKLHSPAKPAPHPPPALPQPAPAKSGSARPSLGY